MADILRVHNEIPGTLLLWPPCFLSSASDKRHKILKFFCTLLSATLWRRMVDLRYNSKHSYPWQLEANVQLHSSRVYPRGKFPLVPIYIAGWIELRRFGCCGKKDVCTLPGIEFHSFYHPTLSPVPTRTGAQGRPCFSCDV